MISTFYTFPVSTEEIFEYITKVNKQSQFQNVTIDIIRDLTLNKSKHLKEEDETFSKLINQTVMVDAFEDFFNSLQLKICLFITLISEFLVSNVMAALFISYNPIMDNLMHP